MSPSVELGVDAHNVMMEFTAAQTLPGYWQTDPIKACSRTYYQKVRLEHPCVCIHTHPHMSSECGTCAGCLVLIPSRSEVFTTRYCLFCARHPISLQTSLASVPTQPLRLFPAHWCPGPPASPNVSTLALLPSPFQEGLQFHTYSLPESLISKMHHREAFSTVGRPPAEELTRGSSLMRTDMYLDLLKPQFLHRENGDGDRALPSLVPR